MKKMSCRELGGACDQIFHAETFEQLAELSKQHGMEMFQMQDPAHLEAMVKMKALFQSPQDWQAWMVQKKQQFESLADE